MNWQKLFRFRSLLLTTAVLTIGACAGSDCEDNNIRSTTLPIERGTIETSFCNVPAGGEVTLFITDRSGQPVNATAITVGGRDGQIVSSTGGKTVVKIPNDAPSGLSTLIATTPVGEIRTLIGVGTTGGTTEVEPNDATDGSNATLMASCQGIGTLSSTTDRDHFRKIVNPKGKYRIFLEPNVGAMFVNGVGVASGQLLSTPNGVFLIGITGGTGNYTVKVVREE